MTIVYISLALLFALGLLACLKGQKLVILFITLYAFLATFQFVLQRTSNDSNGLIIALVVAVIMAILAQYARRVAFFILGFLIGAVIGYSIYPYISQYIGSYYYIYLLVCAIVMGSLFSHWNEQFIRIGTAYIGGEILARIIILLVFNYGMLASFASTSILTSFTSLTRFVTFEIMQTRSLWILVLTLVFTAFGTYYQNGHH